MTLTARLKLMVEYLEQPVHEDNPILKRFVQNMKEAQVQQRLHQLFLGSVPDQELYKCEQD